MKYKNINNNLNINKNAIYANTRIYHRKQRRRSKQ